MNPVLLIGIIALALAAFAYFVLLPHVEGPTLDEQRPDRKEWFVQCPNCHRWQAIAPRTSNQQDTRIADEPFTNWYKCPSCQQRWSERHIE